MRPLTSHLTSANATFAPQILKQVVYIYSYCLSVSKSEAAHEPLDKSL